YAEKISALSEDKDIPRFASQLIFLTKADRREHIEERIVQSIFAKKPKRADMYWFVHINRVNNPYTLDYEVSELIKGKVVKVTINMGFRIQPRTELFFKTIVDDMVAEENSPYKPKQHPAQRYNPDPDFKFVV